MATNRNLDDSGGIFKFEFYFLSIRKMFDLTPYYVLTAAITFMAAFYKAVEESPKQMPSTKRPRANTI
jgi:hypothetical protein